MAYDYIAFIDESGDEGFSFDVTGGGRKSSEWFLLSAVIHHARDNEQIEENLKPFFENPIRKSPAQSFHFRRANHNHCVALTRIMASLPIKVITIIAHKPSMTGWKLRESKNYLFDYCTKLLIERISQCVAKWEPAGIVRIVFSDRRQLKLDRVVNYLRQLKASPSSFSVRSGYVQPNNRINWKVIDFAEIDLQLNESMIGLQLADATVSGAAKAVEYCAFKTTEHRYIKMLAPVYYRPTPKSSSLEWGVKFVPDVLARRPIGAESRFHWAKHFR